MGTLSGEATLSFLHPLSIQINSERKEFAACSCSSKFFLLIVDPILEGAMPSGKADKSKKCLILLHSERPKLYAILAFLSAIGLK